MGTSGVGDHVFELQVILPFLLVVNCFSICGFEIGLAAC
jgi:hypothetical protein